MNLSIKIDLKHMLLPKDAHLVEKSCFSYENIVFEGVCFGPYKWT
jgi:hypothetical protein